MNRPYITCHMTVSIDGKVTGEFLSREECVAATERYYEINRELPAEAFACGRITMEESFTGGRYPDLKAFEGIQIDRTDFVANDHARRYAVSFDRKGRLGWTSSEIEDEDPGYGGSHIIEVLCEQASDGYLAYLRSIGVSYIFAGKEDMNLSLALEKLKNSFGIQHLLLEGGSEINGAFEREGLIDELSLVQAPIIAEKKDKPLFEKSRICDFALKDAKILEDDVLWLRYVKKQVVKRRITRY